MKQIPKSIREIARNLRNNMTSAEVKLWSRIKNEQLGVKFLRQKPLYVFTEDKGLERYIIPDFYCSQLQLIIEADGWVHDNMEVLELDREKEKILDAQWIHIIRIKNEEILKDTDSCIEKLWNEIRQLSLWKREYPTKEGEGLSRCSWVNPNNELYIKYHDEEWGVPVYDDRVLFEFLILEWAQAWLSWEIVLKKRENYRAAFDQFDCFKIAKYSEDKIDELLQNEWIIRNKLKIKSVIKNARVFIKIRQEYWNFSKYLWWHVDEKQIVNMPKKLSEVSVSTKLSDKISRDLKKRWMSFVGTTIIYAYLQAVWVIDDHVVHCFCKN